ncbi:MAG: hypothetical protein A2X48_05655 [Lentisphaerae bacterium GWF2_49_21]|nr:MAG: hypothetical protein A2X48_05655 [Lentisphaerae bacterium GWF2_49_21]
MRSKLTIAALVVLLVILLLFLFRPGEPLNRPVEESTSGDKSLRVANISNKSNFRIQADENGEDKRIIDMFLGNPAAASCSSESASRTRTAQLNRDGLDGLSPGDELMLNLFEDASYEAMINESYTDVNGAKVLTGSIGGDSSGGSMYISTFEGKTVAFVEVPSDDKIFSTGTGNGIDYSVFEQDKNKMDIVKNESDVLTTKNINLPKELQPPDNADFLFAPNISTSSEGRSVESMIDVMFVYTRSASLWAENNYQGPMENLMAIAVARANTVLANSGIRARFRLVHSQEISYNAAGENKGSTTTDLANITFNDTIMEMRNKYGADIVTLVTACEDTGGIGWLFNGNSAFAYNVCRVKQLANSYTFSHECGHTLGCGHSKLQAGRVAGYFTYSAGWQWSGKDGKGYHTVMTYDSSANPIVVPYYSNPSLKYKGIPMGDANDANNSLTILMLKDRISSFRESIESPELH